MATLDDLPRLFGEDPQVREDFLSTFTDFCRRHGIEAAPEDFVGLAGGGETSGYTAPTQPTGPIDSGGLNAFIYRNGPGRSRWIWTGIAEAP